MISYIAKITNPPIPILKQNKELLAIMSFLSASGSGPIAPAT
ncbi:hypothetical protein PQY74_03225 [Nitrosopumilus sp.]|nr:hypothetical protein [Nitrosopumilus sp.]